MGRFPQNFIDDLKAQADIVQVVQDVVPLKKAGHSYKGLCPFHTEKTPSFHVNREKGFFHCFGCGTGGDVVKFTELHMKLSFPEAVRLLAQRFGIEVPASDDAARDAAAEAAREALLKVHELSARYFRDQLAGPSGAPARAYLQSRNIRTDMSDALGLGFAPPQRESLKRHLLAAGQPLEVLLASGLIVERGGGQIIDRFRNRLMIPICRDSGSVIAFGGRALAADQQPKYVNSPETTLYAKGRTLYGLHLTKQAVRRLGYAVLVEGYFDFAQVLQAGVKPVVAICGTAVTNHQARLLRRFSAKVILSFDPDTAGQGASARSGELLVSAGLQVNVAQLPPAEDPDTCVRQRGPAYYVEQLRISRPYLEFVLDRAVSRRDFGRDEQRRAFLTEMLAVAARIPDAAARDQFADRVAHKSRITEDVVRAEVRRAAVARRTELSVDAGGLLSRIRPAEKGLIWAMMRDTAAAQSVLTGMDVEDFAELVTTSIFRVARTLADWPAKSVPATLVERLSNEEAALVSSIANESAAPAHVGDCGIELRKLRYGRERAALQREIDRRQQDGSPGALAEIDALWLRKKDLLQRIEALV